MLLERIGRLRQKAKTQGAAMPTPETPDPHPVAPLRPAGRLDIPIVDQSPEERDYSQTFDRGLYLARQDRWDKLAAEIRAFDRARDNCSCGSAKADILTSGACSDVVKLEPRDAEESDNPVAAGIEMLEEVVEEYPEDYGVALVVARAHILAGYAWRGADWRYEVHPDNHRQFRTHFERAAELLDMFDPFTLDSPALMAARCELLVAQDRPAERVTDDFEDLIDLDPTNPSHFRAFGVKMLPRWFGTYESLDQHARETAKRTEDVWGAGAYAWCYLDALAADSRCLRYLDTDLFGQAMTDILLRRPDQHSANLLAAFSGVLMAPAEQDLQIGNDVVDARAALRSHLNWILRTHLREVHPLVWHEAINRFDGQCRFVPRDTRLAEGRDAAMTVLTRQFEAQIRNGTRVIFSREGIEFDVAS